MIWAFTLLLGWTGVGWLLALIWAFKAPAAARR
jgi:TM2 domain-containing membrane protein YozV